MATIKKIEDLEIWNLACELNIAVKTLLDNIKSARDFKLLDQMRGSIGSIMDNIAEGFGRGGNKEFIQFLSIARGSGDEFKSQLFRAKESNYITKEEFEKLHEATSKICAKISTFINYLKNSPIKGNKFPKS